MHHLLGSSLFWSCRGLNPPDQNHEQCFQLLVFGGENGPFDLTIVAHNNLLRSGGCGWTGFRDQLPLGMLIILLSTQAISSLFFLINTSPSP